MEKKNAPLVLERRNTKQNGKKPRSNVTLIITPNVLIHIKNRISSKAVWDTLEKFYQCKGPARKGALLKQIILLKMEVGEDVLEHLNKFTDTVDELEELEVTIHEGLLSITMLYNFSLTFENYRVTIESRDTLPTPDHLIIKIIEEYDVSDKDMVLSSVYSNEDAFFAKH